MNKENVKAWLGFNLQDTLINISAIPFIIGFFVNNIFLQLMLFAITFILSSLGLILYFKRKNQKVSKATAFLNKWGSILIVLVIWLLVIIKIGWIVTTKLGIFTKSNTITDSGYAIITSEGFPPGEYDNIIDHALVISDPSEIQKISNDYEDAEQNHACGYTHRIEFWSDINTLEKVGVFNEEIGCGGKSLEKYVKKLADSPSHHLYLITIPSKIPINQLSVDLKKNSILSFIDAENPLHLPYIVISLDVYYPTDNNFSRSEEEEYSSNKIDNLLAEINKELKIYSSTVDYCGYFSVEGYKGCSSTIKLQLEADQDLGYAEEYLSNIDNLEVRTVSDHSNYVVSVYDTRDNVEEVREDILDKIDYIISVDKYNH